MTMRTSLDSSEDSNECVGFGCRSVVFRTSGSEQLQTTPYLLPTFPRKVYDDFVWLVSTNGLELLQTASGDFADFNDSDEYDHPGFYLSAQIS